MVIIVARTYRCAARGAGLRGIRGWSPWLPGQSAAHRIRGMEDPRVIILSCARGVTEGPGVRAVLSWDDADMVTSRYRTPGTGPEYAGCEA